MNDSLFRTVEASAQASDQSLANLMKHGEPDLYAALVASIRQEFDGTPHGAPPTRVDDLRRSGVPVPFEIRIDGDDLMRDYETVTLGKRIFQRWNRVLQEFVCQPNNEDRDLRQRVLSAIFGKETNATALVAAVLVAQFGVSAIPAAIIAALVIKLVVAPAADEICKAWAEATQGLEPVIEQTDRKPE